MGYAEAYIIHRRVTKPTCKSGCKICRSDRLNVLHKTSAIVGGVPGLLGVSAASGNLLSRIPAYHSTKRDA
jgi:hypothetical protein